jgi:hypothetical protein
VQNNTVLVCLFTISYNKPFVFNFKRNYNSKTSPHNSTYQYHYSTKVEIVKMVFWGKSEFDKEYEEGSHMVFRG